MKAILFFCSFFFAIQAFSIPDVPNELSSFFKGAGKLPETTLSFKGHELKARLDPRWRKPVLIYEIPSEISEQAIVNEMAVGLMSRDFSFAKVSEDKGIKTFQLYYKKQRVEDGWIKLSESGQKLSSLGLHLPKTKLEPFRFNDGKPVDGLMAVQGFFTEYRVNPLAHGREYRFPPGADVPPKVVVELTPEKSETAFLEKIPLPEGTFPDQIKVDSHGMVWFSQPMNNMITRYDPQAKSWFHKKVGPSPDGLFVDKFDRVWFGEYFGGKLGFYNQEKDIYEGFPMPYSPSNPAIPFEDDDGFVWISDHQQNRLNRFDPKSAEFKSFVVPTANSWTVDIVQTQDKSSVFFTQCYGNQIGKFEKKAEKFEEYKLSTTYCPAFFVPQGENLWISLWSSSAFVKLEPSTGKVTEFQVKDEPAMTRGFGPIGRTSDGKIILGSLSAGKIFSFDPTTQKLKFVTGVGILKDGLTVGSDDTIWVTEMDAFIYRVVF